MRKGIVLAAALAALSRPVSAQDLKAEELVLSNGMKLVLVPRAGEPVVAAGWVAHVGSANERPGITGISHLFEHMMFKGTDVIGSKDPAKDREIMAEQEKVRAEMRVEETKMRAALRLGEIDDLQKPENKTARYKDLEKRFDELVKAQRDLLVKNEFDRIYTKAGASGENAFTNTDETVYFITVPKNKLELWFWMESDRLLSPVFREFYAERDVVFEERRMRTESTPTGRLDEAFESEFWHSFPYSWPVVGYPSDIPEITKAEADEYFGLYYAPNNITACLVGDFDPKEALSLAERYFGRIPRGKNPPPEMTTLPPKWESELRMYGEADTNPQVMIEWHTVPFRHRDTYPLQVLAQVLNGRTGRLYKGLVLPANAVATDASAAQDSRKYAGAFEIDAEAKEGHTPEEVEKGIYAEIDKLKANPVPAEELQKVKNNFQAEAFRRLSSNFPILVRILVNDGLGDYRELNDGPKKIQAVTAEDVQRVARTYLVKENRGVAIYTRKRGSAPAGDADLAGVPDKVRPMVTQATARLQTLTKAEDIEKMISQTKLLMAQVPPDVKKGLEVVLSRAQARLAGVKK